MMRAMSLTPVWTAGAEVEHLSDTLARSHRAWGAVSAFSPATEPSPVDTGLIPRGLS